MDEKTLQWMSERVEKSKAIKKDIGYRKSVLSRVNAVTTSIFFYNDSGNAEFRNKDLNHEFGFCDKIKAEAAKVLVEEIAILEKMLEEI